jgi:hypothetical protein
MWSALGAIPPYKLSENGLLLNPDGSEATTRDEVTGSVDAVHLDDEFVFFFGWAVDLKMHQPVSRVVAIVNGSAHGVATPAIPRPDVVAALKLPNAELSGYLMAARLPVGSTPSQASVRVFAIAADGAVRELKIPPSYSFKPPPVARLAALQATERSS